MASSRVLELEAAQTLSADGASKLLRVFCFLRQHERKARVAKKAAALHAWRPAPEQLRHEPPLSEVLDKAALVDELDGGNRTAAASPSKRSKVPAPSLEDLRRELRELQKGVILGASSTTGVITAADLSSCLRSLKRPTSKADVQWMIWEVDDDLDGCVNWDEFRSCYVRSLQDRHGLEPNQLYYLIQFLLCDADGSQTVSVDELTAELRRVGGTQDLRTKLEPVLRGESEEQQLLRKLTLSEFLDATLGDLPAVRLLSIYH